MKIVRENIEFERGEIPKKSLRVGKYSRDPNYRDFIDDIQYDYIHVPNDYWFVFKIDSSQFGINTGYFSFTLKTDELTGIPEILLWDLGERADNIATIVRNLDWDSDINEVIKDMGLEGAEMLSFRSPGMYVGEGIGFERGGNLKGALDIGLVRELNREWDEVQKHVGAMNLVRGDELEHLLGNPKDLYLQIYFSVMPGSEQEVMNAVGEHMTWKYFDKKFATGRNRYFRIKDPYKNTFISVYNKKYPDWAIPYINEEFNFQRGQIDPLVGMGLSAVHRIAKGIDIIRRNVNFGQISLLQNITDLGRYEGATMAFQIRSYTTPDKALQEFKEAFGDLEPFSGYFSEADGTYLILSVKNHWQDIVRKAYKDSLGLKEGIDFERDMDPLVSMGLGSRDKISKMYKNLVDVYQYSDLQNVFGNEFLSLIKKYGLERSTGWANFYRVFGELTNSQFAEVSKLVNKWWKKLYGEEKIEESYDFERGRDPLSVMGIGSVIPIIKSWKSLEQDPEIRSVDLKITSSGSGLDLQIWRRNALSTNNVKKLVEKYFGDKYFSDVSSSAFYCWYNIKPQYKDLFKRAFQEMYSPAFESLEFERNVHPHKGLGIGKYRPHEFTFRDYEGEEHTIKVQDNCFKLYDLNVCLEFGEFEDGSIEGEKYADVYVDGQKSDMNVFFMSPAEYEFFVPKKPMVKIDGNYQDDPNPENWSKTESTYGYPLVDKDDKKKLKKMQQEYGYWHVSSMDYTRTNKNPFAAVAEMISFTY